MTVLAGGVAAGSPPVPESDRPNIVVILADDLGIGDCGAYNAASRIPTPHIDRLAREGVRFTDAHSPSAVCTPTRYALLVGEYAWRTRLERGVLVGDSRALIEDRTTIAEMLRESDYATACIGKWHLGLGAFDPARPDAPTNFDGVLDAGPHTEGFEHSFIIPASLDMPPYVYVEDGTVVEPAIARTEGSTSRRSGGGGFWRAGAIAPGFEFDAVVPLMTARAEEWIARVSTDERPFFLYLPLPAPHTPWVPAEPYRGATEVGAYGDFVAQLDAAVGRVVAALERADELDDTLIVFTSDNGSHWLPTDVKRFRHRANGPWRGQKADIHEGGHRVPFVVRWPARVPAGEERQALVGLHDLFATFAEIVDAPANARADAIDSVSFVAALPRDVSVRRSIVMQAFDGLFALRHGAWKFIEGVGSGGFTAPRRVADAPADAGRLYDLDADPAETTDLSTSHASRFSSMREMLAHERARRAPAHPVPRDDESGDSSATSGSTVADDAAADGERR